MFDWNLDDIQTSHIGAIVHIVDDTDCTCQEHYGNFLKQMDVSENRVETELSGNGGKYVQCDFCMIPEQLKAYNDDFKKHQECRESLVLYREALNDFRSPLRTEEACVFKPVPLPAVSQPITISENMVPPPSIGIPLNVQAVPLHFVEPVVVLQHNPQPDPRIRRKEQRPRKKRRCRSIVLGPDRLQKICDSHLCPGASGRGSCPHGI